MKKRLFKNKRKKEQIRYLKIKEEQIKWLKNSTEQKFNSWLWNSLVYQETEPLSLFFGDIEPDIYLKHYIYSTEDIELRFKFQDAIYKLFKEWSPSNDPKKLLFYLLNLIGLTRNTKCYETLVIMAGDQQFKEIYYKKFNIHERILAVLFGLPIRDSRIDLIVDRDIEECKFVNLCFRKKCDLTGDIISVAEKLPFLFKCEEERMINLLTFKGFIEKFGYRKLKDNFEKIYSFLGNIDQETFIEYIEYWCLLSPDKNEMIIQEKDKKDQKYYPKINNVDISFEIADKELIDIRRTEKEYKNYFSEKIEKEAIR